MEFFSRYALCCWPHSLNLNRRSAGLTERLMDRWNCYERLLRFERLCSASWMLALARQLGDIFG
jgi:hypothetical protein